MSNKRQIRDQHGQQRDGELEEERYHHHRRRHSGDCRDRRMAPKIRHDRAARTKSRQFPSNPSQESHPRQTGITNAAPSFRRILSFPLSLLSSLPLLLLLLTAPPTAAQPPTPTSSISPSTSWQPSHSDWAGGTVASNQPSVTLAPTANMTIDDQDNEVGGKSGGQEGGIGRNSTLAPTTPAPTMMPSRMQLDAGQAPTLAPVAAPFPPSPGFPSCNVCDNTNLSVRITNPDVELDIPGQPPSTCQVLQRAGDNGFIDAPVCDVVVALVNVGDACGCQTPPTTSPSFLPTMMPTTPAPVTLAPTTLAPATLAPVTPVPTTGAPSSNAPSVSPSEQPSTTPTTGMPSDSPSMLPSGATGRPSVLRSDVPSFEPTTTPSMVPSKEPSGAPSLSPSTVSPTIKPSSTPTVVPTGQPTVSPSAMPSDLPSASPSNAPTDMPSISPSTRPSIVPTLSKDPTRSEPPSFSPSASLAPSESPSTSFPSLLPSASPSNAPSLSPTNAPSALPSILPSMVPTNFDFRVRSLSVTAVQMRLLSAPFLNETTIVVWESTTADFIKQEALRQIQGIVESLDMKVLWSKQAAQVANRIRRSLQQPDNTVHESLLIDFDVEMSIRSQQTEFDLPSYILTAFDGGNRISYVAALRSAAPAQLDSTLFDDIRIPNRNVPTNGTSGGGNTLTNTPGLLIGLVVVIVSGIAIVGILWYTRYRRRRGGRYPHPHPTDKPPVTEIGDPTSDGGHRYASEIELDMRADISTLGDPIPPGHHNPPATGGSITDNNSFTMAYDYQKAYQPSVSTGSTNDGDYDNPNLIVPKDDDTLDAQLAYSQMQFEVEAPAGMLGLVLETSADGVPTVHAIKETSALATQVQVGDRLLSVDGEDVTVMLASDVSRLISSKRDNPTRRFLFSRLPTKRSSVHKAITAAGSGEAREDKSGDDDVPRLTEG